MYVISGGVVAALKKSGEKIFKEFLIMRKTKRIIALLMALIMVLALAACSKKPAEDNKPSEPSTEGKKLGLEILKEEDDSLINNYTVIAVNDKASWKDADGKAVPAIAESYDLSEQRLRTKQRQFVFLQQHP